MSSHCEMPHWHPRPEHSLNSWVTCFTFIQVEYTVHSYTSSECEEEDQENLEDRKYPGEVTTSSFKVKFQPKDSKKDLLV